MGNFILYGLRHKNVLIKIYSVALIFWIFIIILAGIDLRDVGALLVGLIFFALPVAAPLIYIERRQRPKTVSEVVGDSIQKTDEKKVILEQKLDEKCPNCSGEVFEIEKKSFFGVKKEIQCKSCNFIWDNREKLLDDIKSMEAKAMRETELRYVQASNQLPILIRAGSNIILKNDEQAHFSTQASFIEERKKRKYHSGHAGVRVAKGFWIGGTSGHSESYSVLDIVDVGNLALTNQRLLFNGDKYNRSFQLKKITSLQRYQNAIEIAVENREKLQIFKVDDPEKWDVFIRVAIENLEHQK